MACKKIREEWSKVLDAYIEEFICDTDEDFNQLPKSAVGSSAISVVSGSVRVVNAQGEWAPFAE